MSWILNIRDKFSAAHYLREYKGKCEKVHGHTFRVEVAVRARELDRTGIGFDFAEIKAALTTLLPDHALLNEVYAFNPTAENLARHFYGELKKTYPVVSVTVWESEDAAAAYSEDD
ncbi:MAG TPA: 6-carboxytetrahydropterin synthase QueD [Acidobacteriota bacterium]|nr:6-carboxytetrahydropterin synthase QueD [Acidobacteriota bacterium]